MEFSDVGAHCYYDLCRQHTYLPFECKHCHHQFCKNHIQYNNHQCPNSSSINIIPSPPNTTDIYTQSKHTNNDGLSLYTCSYSKCNKESPISILCKDCNQLFCVKHRYPDDHHCGRDMTINNHGQFDDDGYEQINVDFDINGNSSQQPQNTRKYSDSQYESIARIQSNDPKMNNYISNESQPTDEIINVYHFNELRKYGYDDKAVYDAFYHLKLQFPELTTEHPQFMDKMLDYLQAGQTSTDYPQERDEDKDGDIEYPDLNRELSKGYISSQFDVDERCKMLHDVIGIFKMNKNTEKKTKEEVFSELILATNMKQRQEIKERYKHKYHINLDHYINMNFKGIFKRMLLYAMSTEIEREEYLLQIGLKKMKDINVIVQVLCHLESDEIQTVIELHDKGMFRKSMKSQIMKYTADNLKLRAFLMNIIDGKRVRRETNGNGMIADDVHFLGEILGQIHWNKEDQTRFIDIFSKRSFDYLYLLCGEYERKYNVSLIDACDNSLGNQYGVGYAVNCVLMRIMDKNRYFMGLWNKGMKNGGHKYILFWRVIIDRMDIDLDDILSVNGKSDVDRYDFKHFIDNTLHSQDAIAAELIAKICKLS